MEFEFSSTYPAPSTLQVNDLAPLRTELISTELIRTARGLQESAAEGARLV